MPRQSRRSSTPSRPSPPPQSRGASTSTHVPAQAPPPQPPAMMPQQQQKQPGLFAQMATTAAGVAVGSAVGHTIGAGLTGMFSGSGNKEAAQQQQAAPAQQQYQAQNVCEPDARAFQNCLEKNPGDISACQFYLDMLKQCQSNSKQQWA
ncbi:hypothetical protein HDU97_005468 [Phlyctochytrium planicorne]|nr:hypothetical protein HDU97_005468 [Phlyctochytrium planicorne]